MSGITSLLSNDNINLKRNIENTSNHSLVLRYILFCLWWEWLHRLKWTNLSMFVINYVKKFGCSIYVIKPEKFQLPQITARCIISFIVVLKNILINHNDKKIIVITRSLHTMSFVLQSFFTNTFFSCIHQSIHQFSYSY